MNGARLGYKIIIIELNLPNDGVPGGIGQVEDEVFWAVVDWSAKDTVPVLQIGPSFFWRGAREWGETLIVSFKTRYVVTQSSRRGTRIGYNRATSSLPRKYTSFREELLVACYRQLSIGNH
jgi:hypothetical protein